MAQQIPAPTKTICSEGDQSKADLRFLHFNDVYHIEAGAHDPVGGIMRFQTMCNHYRHDAQYQGQAEILSFFSGDGFGPSLESSVTKGAHMIPILNGIPTAAACVGNHDLDLGVPQFEHLTSQCNFPWLLANVFDPALGRDVPLGHAHKTTMLTSSNGIKIGVIGLVEKAWLDAVNALPPNLVYVDPVEVANQLIPNLRAQGAEMIIAICHQREFHDERLAQDTPEGLIDIILGGHDHHYRYSKIRKTHVLCSGSDFKQLSYIEARRRSRPSIGWDFSIVRRDVTRNIAEDTATTETMDRLFSSLQAKLQKVVGYTAVPLDTRFRTVRTKESNMGNFMCDLMRFYYNADCAIMAAGTIRGDTVYPPGVLRLKDIMDCFPFEDPTVVMKIKGRALLQALENGVSRYPALDGRFPQVSNISYTFDPSKPPHDRVVGVQINDEPLDVDRDYSVATREFMVRGGDGYTSLLPKSRGGTAIALVKEENGVLMSMMLRQHFMSSMSLGRWKNWPSTLGKRMGMVHEQLRRRGSMVEQPDIKDTFKRSSGAVSDKAEAVPGMVGKVLRSETMKKPPVVIREPGDAEFSNSEDEAEIVAPTVPREPTAQERELIIARKALRKWWRLAGLDRRHAMGYERGEELGVGWTKGICPQVEGRIKMVLRLT